MKSAGKARNNGLYRHIRTSKEIIRNLLNDYNNRIKTFIDKIEPTTVAAGSSSFYAAGLPETAAASCVATLCVPATPLCCSASQVSNPLMDKIW